jgi:hypothetical protein
MATVALLSDTIFAKFWELDQCVDNWIMSNNCTTVVSRRPEVMASFIPDISVATETPFFLASFEFIVLLLSFGYDMSERQKFDMGMNDIHLKNAEDKVC